MTKRFHQLDGLRGLAATAVVLFHYTTRLDELFPDVPPSLLHFPLGYLGVAQFFMISGAVIWFSARRATTALSFATNRGKRLYPAYILSVLLTAAVCNLAPLPGRSAGGVQTLVNLTMLQEFLGVRHVDGAYWSLTIEIMFYTVIGLMILLKRVEQPELPLALWLAASLAIPIGHSPLGHSLDEAISLRGYAPCFIYGMTAMDVTLRGFSWLRTLNLAGSMASILVELSAASLLAGPVLMVTFWLALNERLRFLGAKCLLFLGSVSYPLYLIHQNIGYAAIRWLISQGVQRDMATCVTGVLAVALAYGIWRGFETPLHAILSSRRAVRLVRVESH